MHLVDVVLFAHIAVAIAAFAVAGLLHTAQFAMRGTTNTSTLKVWAPTAHRIEPWFPVLALALFGLGAWLIGLSDGEFDWSDGWVITSVVGLGVMEAAGGAVLAPRGKRAHTTLMAAGDGPVEPAVHAVTVDPAVWTVAFFETATAIGILFLMATKPNGLASALIVIGCAAAGGLFGLTTARRPVATGEYRQFAATEVSSARVGDGK
jgi:hypothetical protein